MTKKTKVAHKQTNWCYICLYILSLIAVIVGIYVAVSLRRQQHEEMEIQNVGDAILAKLPPNITEGWINVRKGGYVHYPSDVKIDRMLNEVVSRRKPAFIKSAEHIRNWPIKQWNLLDIASKAVPLPNCRLQYEPVFVLGQEREKGGMLGSSHDQPVLYTNITLKDFLVAALKPSLYLYWTGQLSYLEEESRLAAVDTEHSWKKFRIYDNGLMNDTDSNDDIFTPMIWLSHPGVVSQTHYDTQHNIFIQLQGQKRFLLFPPQTPLYPYPNIHRAYRQSQVHFEAPVDNSKFPLSHNLSAIEIVVQPGDILYIPPYWSHRVESHTLSLSLSILSPSSTEAALAEVFWQQVPFGQFTKSRRLRASAVVHFVGLLLSSTHSPLSPKHTLGNFMQSLYHTRYSPLYASKNAQSATTPSFCPKKDDSEVQTALLNAKDAFLTATQTISELLRGVAIGQVPEVEEAVKVTFLMDYVEQISRWAVGPDLVPIFLKECFIIAD